MATINNEKNNNKKNTELETGTFYQQIPKKEADKIKKELKNRMPKYVFIAIIVNIFIIFLFNSLFGKTGYEVQFFFGFGIMVIPTVIGVCYLLDRDKLSSKYVKKTSTNDRLKNLKVSDIIILIIIILFCIMIAGGDGDSSGGSSSRECSSTWYKTCHWDIVENKCVCVVNRDN